MNILQASEKKKVLQRFIEDFSGKLAESFSVPINMSELSSNYQKVEDVINSWVELDIAINKAYVSTLVTLSDNVLDTFSYSKGLEYKIKILASIIASILHKELIVGEDTNIDVEYLISLREKYNKLQLELQQKVMDVCLSSEL